VANLLQGRLQTLIDDFAARYSEEGTLKWLRDIWQSDRWSDYTAFHRTAAYVAEELRRIGARDVEIVPCPADGRTRAQAWTMPLAWEAGEAVLRIVSPHEETLCDRTHDPFTCSMWSEPTLPGGVRGPLIIVDDPAAVKPEDCAKLPGAIILTSKSSRGTLKVFAHQIGAAAILSHHVAHEDRHPEAVAWSNGWSDDAGGWALKASDCPMTGFQVSPLKGRQLRELIARGPVVCEARVGGRIGEGVLPAVVAVLPGSSDKEILLTGHLFETGANDNASGCASLLECIRLMAAMPRPRRTIRIVLTGECYGNYYLYTAWPEMLARTLAGIDCDCVGEKETQDRPSQWARTPEANPGAVDALFRAALRLTEGFPGCRAGAERDHSLSSNVMADPAAGPALLNFMKAPWHWHTNMDDWSGIDPPTERRATVATAAWARWLAEAGPKDADALAETVIADALTAFPDDGKIAPERRAFFLDRARARVLWTKKLGARRATTLAARLPALDFTSLIKPEDGGEEERRAVPARTFWGAPTFDNIPLGEAREGLADPRWNMPYVTAAYWADGRRSVAEIAALVRTEFDKPMPDLLKFFRVLARGGMVYL